MDFSEIADDDISNLGFEFDDNQSGLPKQHGGGGRGGRNQSRGMPHHPSGGPRGGPPPRFMGSGLPFPPMRPLFLPREPPFPHDGPLRFEGPLHRGPPFDQMDPGFAPRFGPRGPRGASREHHREPLFPPGGPHFGPRGPRDFPMGRGEGPGERPGGAPSQPMAPGERSLRPNQPISSRNPRMPPPRAAVRSQNQSKPSKQGKQQNQNKGQKEPAKNQHVPKEKAASDKGAGKSSGNVANELAKNTANGSNNNEIDEEKLLQESEDEESESKGVDLEDAVSIHGDEEFDIEKDEEEIDEKKSKTEDSKKKSESESEAKDDKNKRKVDKADGKKEFNRGRGRGRDFNRGWGGRDFHRGRTPPRFWGPERELHPPLHDLGHRPFPVGPLHPNFPGPRLGPVGKNIHVNPRFMASRPGFDGPRGPHFALQAPHPGHVLPPRPDMAVPGRGLPPRPGLPANPELAPRFVSAPQAGVPPTAHRIIPGNPLGADALVMRNPNIGLPHPAQFPAGMSPAMQVEPHRAGVQSSPHVPISSAMAARTPYEMDRMYLGQRAMGNEQADLAALYNNQAFLARQQQYPAAALQQAMLDMQKWQQQMRPSFDRESAERSAKRTREKPNRKYSDNSDFSSRSRSGSFSDSRSGSYSRSASRSWSGSRSRSLSPSPARSWSKSVSRSRSRTPVNRTRPSPKREVRMPRAGSPSRRVERSARRSRETRREPRRERDRHVARGVRARVEEPRNRSPRSGRGPRAAHEKTRERERGHQESERTRGDRGKAEPAKERQRNRERKSERNKNEGESRERAGSRRSKTDSRGGRDSHASSRHSHRSSPDRKSSNADSKANRVVATKSGTSGKPTNRIVIGSLPDSITPLKLKELLATIGPIEQLKMSTTKHKALVTFEKHEHALACRRKFHRAKVDDSQITVDFL